jgi:hypothetical protein
MLLLILTSISFALMCSNSIDQTDFVKTVQKISTHDCFVSQEFQHIQCEISINKCKLPLSPKCLYVSWQTVGAKITTKLTAEATLIWDRVKLNVVLTPCTWWKLL